MAAHLQHCSPENRRVFPWVSKQHRSLTYSLHIGTLSVVIFYFRREIKIILTDLVHLDFHSEYGRFIPLIVVASIPTGIIGLLYDKFLADNYQTFLIMGITYPSRREPCCSPRDWARKTKRKSPTEAHSSWAAAQGAAKFSGSVKKRLNNFKRSVAGRQAGNGLQVLIFCFPFPRLLAT